MSVEKKFPFNLSPLENITLLSFIAIGFSIIYKTAYYNKIGVSWLINSLNPQLILISSIKFLFTLSIFSMIGFFIIYRMRFNKIILVGTILIFTFTLILTVYLDFALPKFLLNKFNYQTKFNTAFMFSPIIALLIGSFTGYAYTNSKEILEKTSLDSKTKSNFVSYYAILTCLTLIIFPYFIGAYEAQYRLNNIKNQNSVSIKNSSEQWFIVELIGDKAVLIDKSKMKTKIIEIKEIDYIKNID
ncbi:putative membrane protein [Acinetobacter baumannii 1437282]|nr:putative membrane protein [Acinetobacter baumannii 1437282]